MIQSVNNKTIKDLVKLKNKKTRDEKGLFLVDGFHMVEEAKKAGLCDLVISTDESLEGQEKVLVVSDSVMEKLSYTKTPQPIMAVCHKKDNILKHYDRVLILDGVQDPGNLGTILRSALAFGFKQIVMSPDCVDLYNDKALRSTQGAVFHLDIVRDDLSHVIPELQKLGVRVIATSLHNASSIDDIKSTDKMAFVMGNEGNGVRDETIAMSDASLYIPIDTMESLNVGVAAGWRYRDGIVETEDTRCQMEKIRKHFYFSGRVQAVGFRFRAQMNATQLGLTGWVRNLFDGRVEAEVQGEIEQINRFINKMKNEQWIDITDIEVEDIPVEKGERRFDVTY